MTDFGRRSGVGDMLKAVYDPNEDGVIAVAQTEADMKRSVYDANLDGVIAVAQTEADMTKAVYDPVVAAIQALAAAHKTQHQNGGTDEINATGLTGVPVAPLLGDGVAGRVLRHSYFYIRDGTNADTIQCRLVSWWNGDAISWTDNIAKGATTGNFTLSSDGKILTIENSGLSGTVIDAWGILARNETGTAVCLHVNPTGSDIQLYTSTIDTGVRQDLTALVAPDDLLIFIHYITDA